MKRIYAKSLGEYKTTSRFDKKNILAAARRLKKGRKLPTSVALEEETIQELKSLAEWRGVPYQILMRMFILEGLHNSRVADGRPEK
jgi:predicted DNA binding CopG/RHH family protein